MDSIRKFILALTTAAFGIGTTEFIIMCLLPDLAHDFHVSIPKAGILSRDTDWTGQTVREKHSG